MFTIRIRTYLNEITEVKGTISIAGKLTTNLFSLFENCRNRAFQCVLSDFNFKMFNESLRLYVIHLGLTQKTPFHQVIAQLIQQIDST